MKKSENSKKEIEFKKKIAEIFDANIKDIDFKKKFQILKILISKDI